MFKNEYDFIYRNTVIGLNSTNQSKVIQFYWMKFESIALCDCFIASAIILY